MFLISKDYFFIKETSQKGKGVFCKKKIKAKTIIGEYTGQKIKIEEYDLDKDKDGLYLMFLDDEYAIYPDLSKTDIHLINHSCNPNCWIFNFDLKKRVFIFALRDIKKGEELTINYLLPPKDKTCKHCSHQCKCMSRKCSGTMHLSKDMFIRWQNFMQNIDLYS